MKKKRIKVCFISLCAYPLFNPSGDTKFGGAEVQLYQLAKEIAKDENYEVSFAVANFGQNNIEIYDNIKVCKTFSLTRKKLKYLKGFFCQLKFLAVMKKINADVYVQRAAGVETGMIAFFCKLFKKKFIYMTACELDINKQFRKINPLVGIFYEFGIKNADLIITQNENHKKKLKENFNLDSIVVRNSFCLPKENLASFSEREFVLWVGTSQKLKQPEIFLEIAKSIPEEKFVIIMPKHNETLWERISEEVKKIINLTFIEKVPLDKINEYYRKAKLFINTSTYEGFPNTFVQSAMNGTPVASLSVNPDNFLNEYTCGFCADGNSEKLIEKLRQALKDESYWTELSKNARNYAKDNHDMEKNIEKIKNIINGLCKN